MGKSPLVSLITGVAFLATVSSCFADGLCHVSGWILGHDGRPLQGAYVRTFGPGTLAARPTVGRDGRFSLVLAPGGCYLAAAGVLHKTWFVPLLLERPGGLGLTIRLAPADYVASLDSVRVIGDFNRFDTAGAVPMKPEIGGSFVATVPCDRESLYYQLLGVQAGGDPICGTQADDYVLDRSKPLLGGRSSSFLSVLHAGGRPLRITFDPERLPRGTSPPVVSFTNAGERPARIVAINEDVEHRASLMDKAYAEFRARGGARDSFQWDATADLNDLTVQAASESDPVIRSFLHLNCVRLAPGKIDSAFARRILREIPYRSPLWSLVWPNPNSTYFEIARAAKDPEKGRKYAEEVVRAHPDSSVRAAFLYYLLDESHRAQDVQRVGEYYTRMMTEFPGTVFARRSRKEFSPDRAIRVGSPAPAFALKAVEDSTRIYRLADFKGRYLLVDFWATWCGPCLSELKYLRRAHDVYKSMGIAFLSVSLDNRREGLCRLRDNYWVPWYSASEPRGFEGDAARAYEVAWVPKPVLIDPTGSIIAVGDELRGGELARTLARFLGDKSSSSGRSN